MRLARLRRFEQHRFVGARDTMLVYDCDDDDDAAALEGRVAEDDLLTRCLLSSFAPDTLVEAENRGFRPTPRPATVKPELS